jgi:hypothetical protein
MERSVTTVQLLTLDTVTGATEQSMDSVIKMR